jgi:hypothetical protein
MWSFMRVFIVLAKIFFIELLLLKHFRESCLVFIMVLG